MEDFDPDAYLAAQAPAQAQPKQQVPFDQIQQQQFDPDAYLNKIGEQPTQLPEDLQQYGGAGEQLKAGLENVASSGTLGLSTGVERLMGAKPEDILGRHQAHEILHPTATSAENLGGFLGSSLIPVLGEANIVGDVGKGVGALSGAGETAGILGSAIARAPVMGAETALMSAGDEVTKYFSNDPTQTAQTAIANIGLSGLVGMGLGGTFGAAGGAWEAAKGSDLAKSLSESKDAMMNGGLGTFAKKAVSALGGVSEDNIDKYMADREAINNAPDFKEVYDNYLPHIEAIHDAVADGKLNEADSRSALNDVSRSFKDDLRQKGYDASVANTMAKQALKSATTDLAGELQENAIGAAPKIAQSIEGLRQSVVDQSQGAYNILEQSGKNVPLEGFFKKGQDLVDNIKREAVDPGMEDKLQQYLDNVRDRSVNGDSINAVDAKKMIQGLDKVSKYDFNATSFDKGMSNYYKQLRWTLDNEVKSAVPEYREAMKPLASDTGLLSSLGKYGDEASAARKISTLKNPVNFKYEMPQLQQLEQRTGNSFTNEINRYANPEARSALMKQLPEYEEASKMADIVNTLKNPETMKAVEDKIASTPEYAAHQKAVSELNSALMAKEELSGLTPNNLESKLKAAMKGKLNVEKAIQSLPEYEGKPLSEVLENIKTKQAFEGGHTNGSKNVNMFGGLLGGAAGMMGGHVMGGIAGGAAVGSFMDKYGHEAVKKILDFYLDHSGKIPELVGESNKDAVRTVFAKMLDSTRDVSATGFKGLTALAAASLRGDKDMSKYSKALFAGDQMDIKHPSKDQLSKLDEKVKEIGNNPDAMSKIGGNVGHYSDPHGNAITSTAVNAIGYLNENRPKSFQPSPLDTKIEPTQGEQNIYDRKLLVAQSPMVVMQKMKDGTLLPQDVQVVQTLYPAMYKEMRQKLISQMTTHLSKEGTIPYRTRQSLSLFMAQPMDSTMTPQSIQSVQMMYASKSNQQQPTGSPQGKTKKGTSKLGELGQNMQTMGQKAEQRRISD